VAWILGRHHARFCRHCLFRASWPRGRQSISAEHRPDKTGLGLTDFTHVIGPGRLVTMPSRPSSIAPSRLPLSIAQLVRLVVSRCRFRSTKPTIYRRRLADRLASQSDPIGSPRPWRRREVCSPIPRFIELHRLAPSPSASSISMRVLPDDHDSTSSCRSSGPRSSLSRPSASGPDGPSRHLERACSVPATAAIAQPDAIRLSRDRVAGFASSSLRNLPLPATIRPRNRALHLVQTEGPASIRVGTSSRQRRASQAELCRLRRGGRIPVARRPSPARTAARALRWRGDYPSDCPDFRTYVRAHHVVHLRPTLPARPNL